MKRLIGDRTLICIDLFIRWTKSRHDASTHTTRSLPTQLRESDLTLGRFRRELKNASIWPLTAAAPSDSVFRALCTNSLDYLLTYLLTYAT